MNRIKPEAKRNARALIYSCGFDEFFIRLDLWNEVFFVFVKEGFWTIFARDYSIMTAGQLLERGTIKTRLRNYNSLFRRFAYRPEETLILPYLHTPRIKQFLEFIL